MTRGAKERKLRRATAALLTFAVCAWLAPASAARSDATDDDPYRERQWGLARVGAGEAWSGGTGRGALIAIVDSGVDLGHPDLDSKIVSLRGSDIVDQLQCARARGYCIKDGPDDMNGHGTHVAGIAAAETFNGVGVAGVAPDADVMPVRVLDATGSGTMQSVARGIEFAADHDADVVNLSLGVSSGTDKALRISGRLEPVYDAIDYALGSGAAVVVSAGNDTFPLCSEPSAHPRVLCVGATDRFDTRSWYSNSDATMTSNYLVAPGGRGLECSSNVLSTFVRFHDGDCPARKGYASLSGTSMAAPHVSGVAAILAARGLRLEQIVRCITGSALDLGTPGRDPVYGYGRLDAGAAIEACG